VDTNLTQYEVAIDLGNPNTSHTLVADLVGTGKRVLDVGCWTGDLGRALATRGCTVSGLEIDVAAAEKARAVLDEVVVADLDVTPASSHFAEGTFDVVVFADVLEHLKDPTAVLADAGRLLAPGGRVVLSVPNITHGSVRLALLQGRWSYTETGLLDVTHIRFFAREGLRELFREAGMVCDDLRGSLADPLVVEVDVDADRLPAGVVEWVRHEPDALVYQFVAAVRPASADDELTAPLPLLALPVPEENVRAIDKHTQRAEEELEARHRVLTVRDHVIGLEAATATAQTRAEVAERQLKGAHKRLAIKNDRIKSLSRQLRRLGSEAEARVHPPSRGPLSRLRGGPSEQ
jgi:2-polyprenyl-3-methyl-5-hydroxy-6-metoxy-1,4-benzoquinol methylase